MLITPQRPIALAPPCWCGQSWQAHQEPAARDQRVRGIAPDHQYLPADGIESETFDAW